MRTMFVKAYVEEIPLGQTCLIGLDSEYDVRASITYGYLKGGTVVARTPDGYTVLGWKRDADELPHSTYHITSAEKFKELFPDANAKVSDYLEYERVVFLSSGVECFTVPEFFSNVKKRVPTGDGMVCNRCHEPVLQAAPNQGDGSFRCYSCRTNPFR